MKASAVEAYKRLGKRQIPVTYFGTLSEEEREDLELEENIRRKNLTAHERSKLTKREKEKADKEVSREVRAKPSEKGGRLGLGLVNDLTNVVLHVDAV